MAEHFGDGDRRWSSGGARQLRPSEKQAQTPPVLVLDSQLTPHAWKALSEDAWGPLVSLLCGTGAEKWRHSPCGVWYL